MTLPAPVRVVVDTALLAAVHRSPPSVRAEMAREWSAELYAIVHEPASSTPERSWRSLAYTVSLACARGIEEESLTERGSMGMKRFWKPVAVLVAAPVLSVLAVLVIGIAGVMLLSLIQGEGGYAMSGQSFGNDLAATMLTVVAPAAAVWPLARWSGRLAPLEVSSPRTGALSTVALVGTATVAVFGVLVNGLQFQGFGGLPAVVVGVLAWAVALAGVAALAVGLWSIGRRASGSAVAWLGGIAAVDVGVTAFLLSNESMAGSPLASLPLWFPAALWTGDFPESWLGHAGDGMALSFQIPDIAVGYGNILVAVTAFVLGYLGPGRRTVPAASPELAEAAG